MDTGDRIALFALVFSGVSLIWQIFDALRGPELSLLNVSGRPVEFRCLGSKKTCWAEPNASVSPKSTDLIVPVFAANRGGPGYHEVIENMEIFISRDDSQQVHQFAPIAFWGGSAGSRQGDTGPFKPILIEGGGVNGSETRFTSFSSAQKLSWQDFTSAVIDGTLSEITLDIRINPLIEPKSLKTTCAVQISDLQRDILAKRKASNGSPRFTVICT